MLRFALHMHKVVMGCYRSIPFPLALKLHWKEITNQKMILTNVPEKAIQEFTKTEISSKVVGISFNQNFKIYSVFLSM
jgi:hypothetical protein